MTRDYSTWGSKILNHADVLHSIQEDRRYVPITVQLALTENCESHCPFCSVDDRPIKSFMPWPMVQTCLLDFAMLGAKSIELTGGGNPMLYRDGEFNINHVIEEASELGLDVGIITNSHNLSRLRPDCFDLIKWIRISLIKLDEGKSPVDYDFNGFPLERMGFSYIIYDGTTKDSIRKMTELVALHPGVRFVRLAGNCLIKGNNLAVRKDYGEIIEAIEHNEKFFFKDIQGDDSPFDEGCHTGGVRPYIAAHPEGNGEYHVYICTSHVLQKRTYDLDYSLGKVEDVPVIWARMNASLKNNGFPYEVKGNRGSSWCQTCRFCYYKHNNQILHTVAHELPDKNFA
jgi:hypothetical protein